jgi:hypothetical protein
VPVVQVVGLALGQQELFNGRWCVIETDGFAPSVAPVLPMHGRLQTGVSLNENTEVLVTYRRHELFNLIVVRDTSINVARVKQSVGSTVEYEHGIGLSNEDVFVVESNDLRDVGVVFNEGDSITSVAECYEKN